MSYICEQVRCEAKKYGWKPHKLNYDKSILLLEKAGDLIVFDEKKQTYLVRRVDSIKKPVVVREVLSLNFLRDPYELIGNIA